MSSLEMIFREPVTIIVFLVLMVALSIKLTIISFILLPLVGILIGRIGKSLKRNSTTGKEKMGLLLSIMEETLGGLRIIKGFNAEKKINERFRNENNKYNSISVRVMRKVDLASPLSEFLGVAVFVVILYVGGAMVLSEKTMEGAIFITYLALFSQLLPPAKSFTAAYYSVQKGLASAERIDKILNAEVTIKDVANPKSIKGFEKEIEYRNVSFAYREGEVGWVLNKINLKIEKGKTIALVGQSGSGKTTLADMLPRFYDTTEGEILIDGVEIKQARIKDVSNPKPIKGFEKEIEYRNVSFAYREGEVGWVLNKINLKIEKGKTIALVGQSGSGKTTLADMLPRFYDTTEGEILIDGVEIKQARIKDVRSIMGIVTQESILFNDTVYNNIAFGIENVTEQQVIEAAKIANAHQFISEMQNGYQTNIGDRGSKMSGGQRQRISIARAVLKNPPILILDEATSALDTESERLVQDALFKLMKNRTSLVIAHRLSTIQHADEIIVMQQGEIIERGTHSVLLASNGTYKKLYDLQAFV